MTTIIAALALAATTTDLNTEVREDADQLLTTEEGPEGPVVEAAPEAPAPKAKKEKVAKEPKAPRVKKEKPAPRPYPFKSKNAIAAELEASNAFVLSCLQIMQSRQTSAEEESKATISKNARGWMSSQAKKGTELATKARTEGLSYEECEQARALVSRYTKQLAAHFRDEQIAADPSLKEIASLFSADLTRDVGPPDPSLDPTDQRGVNAVSAGETLLGLPGLQCCEYLCHCFCT